MQNFIIVTKEGYTFSPNANNCEISVENLQVFGFARGSNKVKAVQNFNLGNKWIEEAGYSEAMVLPISDRLSDADFEPLPLR